MARFKRILLKLSGESLMGEQRYGIDEKRLGEYAQQIKEIHDMGVQIGIVIGGGNILKISYPFYNGSNQQEICSTVSKWEGWNSNGTIGNGWPILNWQVEHGSYTTFCSKILYLCYIS